MVIADTDDVWKFAGRVTLANEDHGLLQFIPAEKIAHHLNEVMLIEVPA
ncbi:hypothetical protein PSE10A_55400 [Pseudomonas amygdali pv. eriobotryae]|uniref:Uncharacterized protein n=1 Tax=Pseudomonas amygdali pv. eriobotryae TaxID=129137 RepID=A0A9P3AJ82_PSEA0|nr:hypothetical protein PSE10A_55400 [Pseudomonas amygdali pv. eriobotryae]